MRIVAYASASTATPAAYLDASAQLGELVARRGHVLVNGGGKTGGMGAMNASCRKCDGHIVCVIHARFVVDGVDFDEADEMIVASGESLGERKRLLAKNGDVIVAMPGGIGTLDELFEAAALSQLDFHNAKPVALLNFDGYYDGVIMQLERAYKDELLRKAPNSIIYQAHTVEDLLDWCERQQSSASPQQAEAPQRRIALPATYDRTNSPKRDARLVLLASFFLGALCGAAVSSARRKS